MGCRWPKGRFWCFCKTGFTLKGIGWKGFNPPWSAVRVAQCRVPRERFPKSRVSDQVRRYVCICPGFHLLKLRKTEPLHLVDQRHRCLPANVSSSRDAGAFTGNSHRLKVLSFWKSCPAGPALARHGLDLLLHPAARTRSLRSRVQQTATHKSYRV